METWFQRLFQPNLVTNSCGLLTIWHAVLIWLVLFYCQVLESLHFTNVASFKSHLDILCVHMSANEGYQGHQTSQTSGTCLTRFHPNRPSNPLPTAGA